MPHRIERRPAGRAALALRPFAALLSAVLSVAGAAAATHAQDKPAAPAGGNNAPAAAAVDGDVRPILPYLDDGTFIVIRLDVDRVDPAALEKFLTSMAETVPARVGIPADQQGRLRQEMINGVEQSKQWLADMTAAGGRRVYLLFLNADDLMRQHGGAEPLTVVPLAEGVDADRVTQLLQADLFNGRRSESAQIGNAIVQGKQDQLDRIRAHVDRGGAQKPGVDAADLAAALAAAGGGDAPMRFVAIPGERARAWVEENLPTLPDFLGGGDGKLLARDVRWAAAGLAQKPNVLVNVTVKATDAAKAKALSEVLGKGLAFLRERVAAAPGNEETVKQLDALKPRLAGDTIALTADPIELQVMMMGVAGRGAPAPPPGAAGPEDAGL
jgi:hypothetical protein